MKRAQAFLLAFLMLTLPLHAIAGKVMTCESWHAAASSPSAQMDAHAHGASHVSPISMQMDHHSANTMEQVSDSASALEKAGGSCSVCASCPMGSVSMLMHEFRLPSLAVTSESVAYLASSLPEIDPELPDDPPRV